jgi:hypothetical protein
VINGIQYHGSLKEVCHEGELASLSAHTANKKGRITATFACGVGRDRTADTRIFSPLLYRLSYRTAFPLRTRPVNRGAIGVAKIGISGKKSK